MSFPAKAQSLDEEFDLARLRALSDESSIKIGANQRSLLEKNITRRESRPDDRPGQASEQADHGDISQRRMGDSGLPANPAANVSQMLACEADHRIKNNLQTVAALLHQQARRTDIRMVQDALNSASARVEAIAQVHHNLSKMTERNDLAPGLQLQDHLKHICSMIMRVMSQDPQRHTVLVEVEPCALPLIIVQRLGMLVTELVTNALRHALVPGRLGTVRVSGNSAGNGRYRLCVEDDGRGLPHGFDLRLRQSGLGLRLAIMLVDQMQAQLTAECHNRAGSLLTVILPLVRSVER